MANELRNYVHPYGGNINISFVYPYLYYNMFKYTNQIKGIRTYHYVVQMYVIRGFDLSCLSFAIEKRIELTVPDAELEAEADGFVVDGLTEPVPLVDAGDYDTTTPYTPLAATVLNWSWDFKPLSNKVILINDFEYEVLRDRMEKNVEITLFKQENKSSYISFMREEFVVNVDVVQSLLTHLIIWDKVS